MLFTNAHYKPTENAETFTTRIQEATNSYTLQDALSSLHYIMHLESSDSPRRFPPTKELAEALLEKLEENQPLGNHFFYPLTSNSRFHLQETMLILLGTIYDPINHYSETVEPIPDLPKRIWKAIDRNLTSRNLLPMWLRLLKFHFQSYPHLTNDPTSVDRLMDIVLGKGTNYSRACAIQAIQPMIVRYPELAERGKDVTLYKKASLYEANPESSFGQAEAVIVGRKKRLNLVDMAQIVMLKDLWRGLHPATGYMTPYQKNKEHYEDPSHEAELLFYTMMRFCPKAISPEVIRRQRGDRKADPKKSTTQRILLLKYLLHQDQDIRLLPEETVRLVAEEVRWLQSTPTRNPHASANALRVIGPKGSAILDKDDDLRQNFRPRVLEANTFRL